MHFAIDYLRILNVITLQWRRNKIYQSLSYDFKVHIQSFIATSRGYVIIKLLLGAYKKIPRKPLQMEPFMWTEIWSEQYL
jgi:hypothetical protein